MAGCPARRRACESSPASSAAQAAAAVLGAPLMHDFATISLSDLMTPWEVISQRIEAAARADFVLALYNPASKKRVEQLDQAFGIVAAFAPPKRRWPLFAMREERARWPRSLDSAPRRRARPTCVRSSSLEAHRPVG